MKRRHLFILVALVLFLSATSAQATLLSIGGDPGTYGSIPRGASNELLESIYGITTPRGGYFGSTVQLTAPAWLTFTFLGFEAGYDNEFNFDGAELFSTEAYTPDNTKTGIFDMASLFYPTAGAIPFSFDVNSDLGGVANGSNPDDSASNVGVNFFSSFDHDPSATVGDSLIVFLDDGGAGPDDDHDDFAVRIQASPVPEPATMLLLGSGLLGLAALRRKLGGK